MIAAPPPLAASASPAEDLLTEVPLFASLDLASRVDLAGRLEMERHAPGDTICRYGDPGDALYLVRSGKAEIWFKNDTGERMLLETAEPGDFFGEISLLDEGPRSATVEAVEPLELLRLDRDDFEAFVRSHPDAALELLAVMARRLRFTGNQLRHTATRNVNEEVEDTRTPVTKAADWIAEFSGSIPFLALHAAWFLLWIGWNTLPGLAHFDPFPFGLLTMTVSLEAIFLSVFVLLSQNRQAAKDRVRSDIEYEVNLKAEMEVAHLHEKLDQTHADVLERLARLEKALGTSKDPRR